MILKYNDKIVDVECKCNRTIKEEAIEISNRLKTFYMKLDGSYNFKTPHECQVYPLVLDLIQKIIDASCIKSEKDRK